MRRLLERPRPDTDESFTPDGFLRTGDIAVMDDDGWFQVVDRKKELIIAGGFNIYPSEVEEVLYTMPGIADCVVVGVPDAYRGETVKAFIVLQPGVTLDEAEVKAYCAERLTPYKVPKLVEFRDDAAADDGRQGAAPRAGRRGARARGRRGRRGMSPPVRVLVVDNRDSFVHNLVHYLRELGATVEVRRQPDVRAARGLRPAADRRRRRAHLARSRTPEDAGSSLDLIHGCARTGLPLLGVCLGHQAIAFAYGGVVGPAPELHPRRDQRDRPPGAGVLHGLPDRFPATRYHSLAVEEASLPAELEVTARTPDGHRDGAAAPRPCRSRACSSTPSRC